MKLRIPSLRPAVLAALCLFLTAAIGAAQTGRITGTVKRAGLNTAMAGVNVYVYTSGGVMTGPYVTDASGTYITTASLATGTYYVRTSNTNGYIDQVYNGVACAGGGCDPTSVGTGVSVTSGSTTSGIDFVLNAGGNITGTVTASGGGALSGASVYVYDSSGSYLFGTTTSGSTYTTPALPAGHYYLRANSPSGGGYLSRVFGGVSCSPQVCMSPTTGTLIQVTTGNMVFSKNFVLEMGGSITGTVTATVGGTPVSGVAISAYNGVDAFVSAGTTNASGVYSIDGLAPGTYYVKASPTSSYLTQLYQGVNCGFSCAFAHTTTGVVATLGGTTTGIDFSLALGGTISGKVTAASGSTPLSGVTVMLYLGTSWVQTLTTNASGNYTTTLPLPPGTYYARTINTLGYVDQLYYNQSCPGGSCTVTNGAGILISTGLTRSNIDFALQAGGSISGTVSSGSGPLSGVGLKVVNGQGAIVSTPTTNASGLYTASALPAGNYYVQTASAPGYINQKYNGFSCPTVCLAPTTATAVSVTVGSTTGNINFTLAAGGSISGTVTDSVTHSPISGVTMFLYLNSGTDYIQPLTTNASGHYATTVGLAPGNYYVRASAPAGYVSKSYSNSPCMAGASCDLAAGTAVPVSTSAVTGIDIALDPSGVITGHVTDKITGSPISGLVVEAWVPTLVNRVASATTNNAGVYTMNVGLTTGAYYLRTTNQLGYVNQVYDTIECANCSPTTGTPVNVTLGATTSGKDFALAKGAILWGHVASAATSTGLAGVTVTVYDRSGAAVTSATTDGVGNYQTLTGLPTETYFARTSNTLGYVDMLYNHTPCGACVVTSGTAISVVAGTIYSGISFSLPTGGAIAGRTENAATHAVLPNVTVIVYDSLGRQVGTTISSADGVYSKGGLADGVYFLRTQNSAGFVDERYAGTPCPNGACVVTAGTPVTVSGGATTPGIDFSLQAGGAISGSVSSASSGDAISNVTVTAFSSSGRNVGSTTTALDGTYSIGGLPTGNYFASTSSAVSPIEYADLLYNAQSCPRGLCRVTSGTPIAVTAGATTPNIDFMLQGAGSIFGQVTDAGTGQPVPNQEMLLYDALMTNAPAVMTDGAGRYRFGNLGSGTYYVAAMNSASYPNTFYSGVPCSYAPCNAAAGTAIAVTAGASTTGINFSLSRGASITGIVTDASTLAVVGGATVYAYDNSGKIIRADTTDAFGAYALSGLLAGTYYVRATATSAGYVSQMYGGVACPNGTCDVTTGTAVVLPPSGLASNTNVALPHTAGFLNGMVTDATSTGAVGTGVTVYAYDASGRLMGSASVVNGAYTIGGLPAGSYHVQTGNTSGYTNQAFSGVACSGACAPTAGSLVAVSAGLTTFSIDFSLTLRGVISGFVRDNSTLATLANVTVSAYNGGGTLVGSVQSSNAGSYAWPGLPAGTYYLRTSNTMGYSDKLFSGIDCASGCVVTSGSPITVVSERTTGGVDLRLTRATLPAFTDPTLFAHLTPIKVAHIVELRQRIAQLRQRYNMPAFSWTDPTLVAGVTPAKAAHVTDLRRALDGVYLVTGTARPSYTNGTLVPQTSAITTTDLSELRSAVAAIW